jgi:hypothetical protein
MVLAAAAREDQFDAYSEILGWARWASAINTTQKNTTDFKSDIRSENPRAMGEGDVRRKGATD